MVERTVNKSKTNVALQAQMTKEKKGGGKWNVGKGRWNHQEGSSSNQRQSYNQGNHRGGGEGRGRDDERKPDKSHIQCYNYQKYDHYVSQCQWGKRDQESDAKLVE